MNCTDPTIKKAFDEAAKRYKDMQRNDDGSPVNPNYPSAVIWECMTALKIDGPVDVHDAQKMGPVQSSFRALFEADMALAANKGDVAHLVVNVKRTRVLALASVRLCMSGQYRS
jgi:hypothetical protein